MTPVLWIVVGIAVWIAVAVPVATLVGRSIRVADRVGRPGPTRGAWERGHRRQATTGL